ncbi:MAG: ParA family protein [Clostridia bacterium]|nr:ParA family protein [Clostridia bacterium]
MGKVIAVANQKGGVGKTTTTINLGIGLVNEGKKVLLIDCDAQGSLTQSLGYQEPDKLSVTLSTLMQKTIEEQPIKQGEGILRHNEGVDLVPANIELSGMETALVNVMSRERVLKNYIDSVKENYDYVLIDCTPSLGMLTINSLAAADEVIIPVQAHYLPLKGLEQLVSTVTKVQRQINPDLKFNGILVTMVDRRTLYNKEVSSVIRLNYGKYLKIFKTEIPHTVKAAEASAVGKSVYAYDSKGLAAEAYRNLTKEVLDNGKHRDKHREDYTR